MGRTAVARVEPRKVQKIMEEFRRTMYLPFAGEPPVLVDEAVYVDRLTGIVPSQSEAAGRYPNVITAQHLNRRMLSLAP